MSDSESWIFVVGLSFVGSFQFPIQTALVSGCSGCIARAHAKIWGSNSFASRHLSGHVAGKIMPRIIRFIPDIPGKDALIFGKGPDHPLHILF